MRSRILLYIGTLAPALYAGAIVSGPTVYGNCALSGSAAVSDTASPLGMRATFSVSLTAGDSGGCSVEWYFERQVQPPAGEYINTMFAEVNFTRPVPGPGIFLVLVGGVETVGWPQSGLGGTGGGFTDSAVGGPWSSDTYVLSGSEVTLRQRLVLGWSTHSGALAGETYGFSGFQDAYLAPAASGIPEPRTFVLIGGSLAIAFLRRSFQAHA